MKKKMMALLLTAVFACGVVGCGNDAAEQDGTAAEQQMDDTEQTAEEMQTALQQYAADLNAEGAVAAGLFTIADGAVAGGQEHWDAFLAGETDQVTVCQFSQKGGAILDMVKRLAGGGYLVVSDVTRDGYEYEEKEDYTQKQYACLTVFDNFVLKEGDPSHVVCVLSDEAELDEDAFRTYWVEMTMDAHQVYPLFVI